MLKIKQRHLPHWTIKGAVYFITVRLFTGYLTRDEIILALEHIKSGHDRFYSLFAVQVMPNHVHCILKPNEGYALSRILKGIKGVTARLINQTRGSNDVIWQSESYDRIIRNQIELDEKLNYIYENPVRSGLVKYPSEYWGWFLPD